MTRDEKDWRQLCARAAVEPDPRQLLQIIDQLIMVLDDRREKMRKREQQYESDSGTEISSE
jgi:hypothetical protein